MVITNPKEDDATNISRARQEVVAPPQQRDMSGS